MVVGVAVGLILILAGAFVAIDRGIPWSLPIFALGFGLVLALTRINRRYRHSSPTLRRTIDVSGSFLDLSLLAGILIVANVLAFRYGGQPLDLTREGTYSLTPESVAQVKLLDRPMTFTVISGRDALAELQKARVQQLLEAYRSIDPRTIRITELNPYEDAARIDELTKRVPELRLLRGGGVLIEYGDDKETPPVLVRNQELFELPSGPLRSGDRFTTPFTGEDAITSALLRLREGKTVKVAFTTGHGEPKPDDPGGAGLADWRARLVRVGCQVLTLNLGEADVPDDVALLIVAGPVDPFKPQEVARIRAYADRGGPLMLLLPGNERTTGLEEFLKAHNLEIGKGLVLDPRSSHNGLWHLVVAASRSGVDHPISAAMAADRFVLLPYAAPIHIAGQSARPGTSAGEPADKNLVPSAILRTGPNAWAETDLKNPRPTVDRSSEDYGPITVGVAVARRKGPPRPGVPPDEQPRLVLFSCPLMAQNMYLDNYPANLDLLMNAASWLRDRPDTLGISPQTHTALTLNVDPQLRSRLIMVPSVTAAMLIIAMGITVYVARRE